MGRLLGVAALGVALLVAVLAIRALALRSHQEPFQPAAVAEVDPQRVAANLAAALRYRTVSHFDRSRLDPDAFLAFHSFLVVTFPTAHRVLDREMVDGLSLLYTWPGSDPALEPVLLLAHQDVVPAPPQSAAEWTQPPFDGVIADGFVWGRGAMDDKGDLMAILEAVEWLLEEELAPRRTALLAFGHDEEVGGGGARAMAALLESRGVRATFVLDEGSAVIEPGVIPGIDTPVAFVGIGEKGYLSVELIVKTAGGHSSTPPPTTAVGIVASAIHRLERDPMPARLEGTTRSLFEYLGPEMSFAYRTVFANLWLFGGLVKRQLASNRATNATLRTTTAATMFSGSPKDNVLPSRARAVVNFRILPGDSVAGVLEHVRGTVNDPRVEIRPVRQADEPSTQSDVESPQFRLLGRTIREVYGDIPVAPNLVLGGTDARHYTRISPDAYRFSPARMRLEDLKRVHGIDERASIEDHAEAVRFYIQLLRNAAS